MEQKWTPEIEKVLRDGKAAGETASMIAERLGYTRSSVIGKANRLGLGRWKSTNSQPRPGRPPKDKIKHKWKPWSKEDIAMLTEANQKWEHIRIVSEKLCRTPKSVMCKARELGLLHWPKYKRGPKPLPAKPKVIKPKVPTRRFHQELSKAELRNMFATAWANTAKISVEELV